MLCLELAEALGESVSVGLIAETDENESDGDTEAERVGEGDGESERVAL